ncbi:MAG: glycoside hydrolase family 2 [Paenibacillus sp.]|nr:glycoside hydrolase family 2 [Paenibacillus sp.]
MKTIQLDGTWKLFGFPQGSMKAGSPEELETLGLTPIPAQVPGNVELDLVVAGQLADPYTGDRILSLQPLERHEWWYVTEFATPAFHGDVELVFHGSDCIATYWLNGERIGSSDNAFIEHRFEISGRLRSMDSNAANTLVVRLESAVLAAMEYPYAPSMYALAHNWEQLWLRKPAHGFSWDIMPRAVSAGLWRSVELVVHERNEVEDVYLFTQEASESSARIGVYYTLRVEPEKLADLKIRVVGRCGDSVFERTDRAKFVANMLDISVRKPKLWWPRGYGAAHLYEVTVQLLLDGQVLSERSATLGIRKVELVRSEITSAEHPGQFLFSSPI